MSFSRLNKALLNELDRLGNEELSGEELQDEINRANAITGVAAKMIDLGNLGLSAAKVAAEYGISALPQNFKETYGVLEHKKGES